MIDMKSSTKAIIAALETNLNGIRSGEIYQLILREEIDCIIIKFPYKKGDDGVAHWADLTADIYARGQFNKEYKEVKPTQ